MGSFNFIKTSVKALSALCLASFMLAGCLEKQNIYDPNVGKNNIPAEKLPDFSTRSEINLNVDYEAPGWQALVQIFTEYPFDLLPDGSVVQKENLLPIFAAFTDKNAKLITKFELPTAVQEVYLCCPTMGMQSCSMVKIVNNTIDFKASTATNGRGYSAGYARAGFTPNLRLINSQYNLYALCEWNEFGKPTATDYYIPSDVGNDFINSLQKTLWRGNATKPNGLNNSQWMKDETVTNITILEKMKDDTGNIVDVKSAAITLTFISEGAWFQDVFGYYYYPTDQKPTNASLLKKYVAMPNVSKANHQPYGLKGSNNEYYSADSAPLDGSKKMKLWYIDEKDEVHEKFPPGYTIGWFVIPNGFNTKSNNFNYENGMRYSNDAWNNSGKGCCISMNSNGKVVVGIEDSNGADNSFEDLLFYVDADPEAAIFNPDRPNIDEGGDVTASDKSSGTYAFEDQWPNKGDYDMNDVVVEYERVVTFNKDNKITKIVDTFKPVQRPGSASYHNAFAYQVDATQIGSYTLPEGAIYEEKTHSFILFANAASVNDKTFSVTRTFSEPTILKTALKSYNPFIIVDYQENATSRKEVHLPKKSSTSLADPSLSQSGEDAYYIDIDGKHPFAIDIPIWGFIQPLEKNPVEVEYPSFTSWVKNGCGTADANWYTKHIGK